MKKIISIVLISFIIVVITTGIIVVNAFDNEKLNILVYGIDGREDSVSERSDAIILVNVNFENSVVTATSIPRDSYVKITCKGNRYDKISKINLTRICTFI